MFKKRNPIKISGKWNYYPQRSIENEPITIDDKMRVMSPSRESGSEYLKKHFNFINNSLERDFVAGVISQMSDEADAIYELFEDSPLSVNLEKISILLAHGYCFAMTENLFDMARKGLISGACRDAIGEFAMLDSMQNPDELELTLHCLYRGFEVCRERVPVDEE
jgi:hypothetical protein